MQNNQPGRILPCKTHTKINDMTWPSYDQDDLEWQLRYGREQDVIESRLRLASIVAAYKALIELTQSRRNMICKALRNAKEAEDAE